MKRKLFGRISAYFFVVLIFLGSIGVNVFEHFCHQDGTSVSFFVPHEHVCEPIVQEEPSCCHEAPEQVQAHCAQEFDSNCCSEAVSFYKISSDFGLQKIAKQGVVIASLLPVMEFFHSAKQLAASYHCPPIQDPPPISGKQILIEHQVFRI